MTPKTMDFLSYIVGVPTVRLFGTLAVVLTVACGKAVEPEFVIEESIVTTPAGTEHVQVFVPASAFTMGSSDGPANARPAHEVMLDAFYIDKYEVTNAQYLAYAEATGSERPQFIRDEGFNDPNQPVVGILWYQARDYCQWAGLQLPSEAQWELAAAGTDGRVFPWGDEPADASLCNFNFSAGPTPVGEYPEGASPFGALDMAGNVWEWTRDEYQHTFYATSPVHNPVNLKNAGMEDGPDRTLRGGSWFSTQYNVRVFVRSSVLIMEERAESRDDGLQIYAYIGFRCAREK